MSDTQTRIEPKRLLILLPAIVSIVLLYGRYHLPGLGHDGVTYLQISRNILLGKGLGWQALWTSPFHSILIATTSYLAGISDLLRAASFISPLMSFILTIAVYRLAENLFDRKTALAASLIAATSPHLLSISFSVEPEITYTALLTVSLALFSRGVTRKSVTYAAVSGGTFALAYLSRSEGFLVMVFVFLAILCVQGRRFYKTEIFRLCAVATVVFFVTSAPYLYFLHKNYGALVISPKASYVLCWLKRADLHIPDAENIDVWGLSSNGRLKWQEPRGISDLYSHLMSDPAKNLALYLQNLSKEIPGRIPNNSGMERFPQLIPIYIFIAAAASLFLNWGLFQKEKKALLLAPLLMLFILPLFNGAWWKYLAPYLPVVVILAAKGITGWAEKLAAYMGTANKLKAEFLLSAAVVSAIVLIYCLALLPEQNRQETRSKINIERANYADAMRELGDAAYWRFGPGRNYMAKWSKLIYYLNGFWTAFPLAPYDKVLGYAKEHKVDYIVVESKDPEEMLRLKKPPPGLELVEILESRQYVYMVAFYKLTE